MGAVTAPIVIETQLELEPVSRDPFIDDVPTPTPPSPPELTLPSRRRIWD